jgi:hypothetical protein
MFFFVVENQFLKIVIELFRLTMTQPIHHNHSSPRESPTRTNLVTQVKEASPDPVVESELVKSPSLEQIEDDESEGEMEEVPVGPSNMPMSPSIEYLDDDDFDEEEDDEDKFNYDHVAPSMVLRPPPTSISTIRLSQQNRVKWVFDEELLWTFFWFIELSRIKPSKEMVAALKVLKDHLEKSPEPQGL